MAGTALLRHGVPFTYSCLSGNCGARNCQVLNRLDAAIFELACSENTLTPAERDARVILACRSEVLGSLKIRLPGTGGG
jgi:ferredoxin